MTLPLDVLAPLAALVLAAGSVLAWRALHPRRLSAVVREEAARVAGRVEDHHDRLQEHGRRLDDHEERLDVLTHRISRLSTPTDGAAK